MICAALSKFPITGYSDNICYISAVFTAYNNHHTQRRVHAMGLIFPLRWTIPLTNGIHSRHERPHKSNKTCRILISLKFISSIWLYLETSVSPSPSSLVQSLQSLLLLRHLYSPSSLSFSFVTCTVPPVSPSPSSLVQSLQSLLLLRHLYSPSSLDVVCHKKTPTRQYWILILYLPFLTLI